MNPAEVTTALNRNTEAINALAKSFQRDPMREFVLGHSLQQNPLEYADRVQILNAGDAFNVTGASLSASAYLQTGDFKFPHPTRKIEICAKGLAQAVGYTVPATQIGIAFSNTGNQWTNYALVPCVSAILDGYRMGCWAQTYDLCTLYVRIAIACHPSFTPYLFPQGFFTKYGGIDKLGTDSQLSLSAYM